MQALQSRLSIEVKESSEDETDQDDTNNDNFIHIILSRTHSLKRLNENTSNVERLRDFGCYGKSFNCCDSCDCSKYACYNRLSSRVQHVLNYWIQITMVTYHITNIMLMIPEIKLQKHIHTIWCPSMEINLTALQIESLFLYVLAAWPLRHHYDNDIIRHILRDYYIPFNLKKKILITTSVLLPFITGFTTGFDDENWEFGKKGWFYEVLLCLFDIIRYIQPAVTIVILCGMLCNNV